MKRILVLAAAMTAAASIAWAGNSHEDSKMDKFIDKLMDKMTVEEKIGQLNLPVAPTDIVTGPAQESDIAGLISEGKIGGLFNVSDVKKVREIQELAVENSPMLYTDRRRCSLFRSGFLPPGTWTPSRNPPE